MRSTPIFTILLCPEGHSFQSSESPPTAVSLGQGGSDQGSGGFWSKYSSFDLVLFRLVSKAPLRNTFWKEAPDCFGSNPSRTSRIRGKGRNCEIIKATGCCFEKTAAGHQPPARAAGPAVHTALRAHLDLQQHLQETASSCFCAPGAPMRTITP